MNLVSILVRNRRGWRFRWYATREINHHKVDWSLVAPEPLFRSVHAVGHQLFSINAKTREVIPTSPHPTIELCTTIVLCAKSMRRLTILELRPRWVQEKIYVNKAHLSKLDPGSLGTAI